MPFLAALILGAGVATAAGTSTNHSICVSNTGQPYDHWHCDELGPQRGCVWQQNQCVCKNGGWYAKSSHYCWPPGSWTEVPTQRPLPPAPPTSPKPDSPNLFDLMVSWCQPHWIAGILDALFGGCCLCFLPCTRQNLRRYIRRQPLIAGAPQTPMLRNQGGSRSNNPCKRSVSGTSLIPV